MVGMRKSVFLDMHGMLNQNHPHHSGEGHIEWFSDTIKGLRLLHLAGYALIVISHEAEAARGRDGKQTMSHEEAPFLNHLAVSGIPLSGYFRCPHYHQGTVAPVAYQDRCRKSNPELLIQAACKLRVAPQRSWFIGDTLDDMQAGRTAGCRTILLMNGQESNWNMTEQRWPGFIAANMIEATSLILLTDVDALLDRTLESLRLDDEEEAQ
jgi:D-glycero-D-manno-heptose 1,7-bisphosphate phosphatase